MLNQSERMHKIFQLRQGHFITTHVYLELRKSAFLPSHFQISSLKQKAYEDLLKVALLSKVQRRHHSLST